MVRIIVANLWSRLSVHWTTRCRVQLCELISSTSVMWWCRCLSISKRELQLKSKTNFILSRLLKKTPEETLKIKLFSRSWSRQDWTQERKCLKNKLELLIPKLRISVQAHFIDHRQTEEFFTFTMFYLKHKHYSFINLQKLI